MTMTTAPPDVPLVSGDVSIVRLHGEACWHCGAVGSGLVGAGLVGTAIEGGHQIWPIVTCRDHLHLAVTR